MNNVIWKSFKLGNYLDYSAKHYIEAPLKKLQVYSNKEPNTIANVTASKENNGIVGYIDITPEIESKKKKNVLTMAPDAAYAGICFYQPDYVVSTGHNKLIEITDSKIKLIFDNNPILYKFLAKLLTKTFRNENYGWGKKGVDYSDFNNNIIMFPYIETTKEKAILEENNRYYTLAVEYIESLMEIAKERREENTIKKYEAERKKYEAERKKYEAERKKYEAEYLTEKNNVVWKCNKIGDLFDLDGKDSIPIAIKNLDVSNIKTNDYPIALISQSSKLNGVTGYISKLDNAKYFTQGLTYADLFGLCFYHYYDFYLIHSHVNIVVPLNSNLKILLNNNPKINKYLAKVITKICRNGIYSYNWLPNTMRTKREYIELPWIECNKEKSIIEEEGKYYTLAVNYISYIYLSGRIKNC